MQPRDNYPGVLHASDVCLVTLRQDVSTPTVPSKLLSIMAAARPVVLSAPLSGDAPRLVADTQCGLCAPPGSPRDLAAAILTLRRDATLCEQLGRNGRAYIEAYLTVHVAAARYEALFQRLIADQATYIEQARSGRCAAR